MTSASTRATGRRHARRIGLAVLVVALALAASVGSSGPDRATTSRCPPADRDEMVAAVTDQLAAIGERDWATALTFTTAGFRAAVDEAGFERIIVDGFPIVAAATEAEASSCLATAADAASLRVSVGDPDGARQDLVYLFEREQRRWRIAGATPADRPDDDIMSV